MNDSSHNDGFEVRPLTDTQMRSLDVGDFFEHDRPPRVMRVVGAALERDATSAEATLLCTPPPSLWRTYVAHWRLAVPFVLATIYLATLRSLAGAALAGVTAGIAALPLRWWREERDEHRARQAWALRNIARRRAQRGAS